MKLLLKFWTKFKVYKIFLKGEIIQEWCKIELWFFDTVPHLNALYHCVKFKQIISKDFKVIIRKNNRGTEGQTDKVATICSPLGEHKNPHEKSQVHSFAVLLITIPVKLVDSNSKHLRNK
jgi:hypothetical protein